MLRRSWRGIDQFSTCGLLYHPKRDLAGIKANLALGDFFSLCLCHAKTITQYHQRKKSIFKLTHYPQ
jgi:hypothetical protein